MIYVLLTNGVAFIRVHIVLKYFIFIASFRLTVNFQISTFMPIRIEYIHVFSNQNAWLYYCIYLSINTL